MPKEPAVMKLPSFDDVSQAVALLGMTQSASQLHGLLCAFLCAGSKVDNEVFLTTLVKNSEKERDEVETISQLYQATKEQIATLTFEFYLLLPDDDAKLQKRAFNLGQWCQGFTTGLNDTGILTEDMPQEELRDALFHISEIAELNYNYDEVTEEDEKAFADVAEYVRMAILMIHTELTHQDKPSSQGSDTLH